MLIFPINGVSKAGGQTCLVTSGSSLVSHVHVVIVWDNSAVVPGGLCLSPERVYGRTLCIFTEMQSNK